LRQAEIQRVIANDEVDPDEEITNVDNTMLVRLGVMHREARRNVRLACAHDMHKARLSNDPDHEHLILKRLKFELYGHAEELVETLRDVTEVAVSSTMQQVLTEIYSGQAKDAFGTHSEKYSLP
jgi:hypothetical protein